MAEVKNTKLKNRTKSGKKAKRAAGRRRVFNIRRQKTMKDALKTVLKLVSEKKGAAAEKLIPDAYQAIDKACKRGIIKPNTASRMKAGIVKQVRAVA